MAPERFGNDEITYRADIYALACVLHECLTGTTPYLTDSLRALMAAHLTQPTPRPSQQNPGIPAAFDEVIACGMAKSPADRYVTAGDFAKAAQQALSTTDQHRAATLLEHSQQHAPPPTGPIPWTQPPPWPPTPPPAHWTPPPGTANRGSSRPPSWPLSFCWQEPASGWQLAKTRRPPRQRQNHHAERRRARSDDNPIPPPPVSPTQLESLLLSPLQVNTMVGGSGMQVSANTTELDKSPFQLSKPDCLGALNRRPILGICRIRLRRR